MVKVSGYDYSSYGGVEYQRFKSDYFTGADIRIYFGDIWVDEVTSLQFTLQEQVAPIFGYASYTWDRVARGNRYIQGSFTINFKESYYLQSVMNSLTSKMKGSSTTSTGFSSSQWKKGLNIEHLMSKSGDSFNSIADEFEKSLWGEGKLQTQVDSKNGTTYFYPNATGGVEIDGLNQGELADHGFNILIAYGPMNESNGMTAAESAHSLVGVQLTGVSQMIGGDGNPIQEQYTFIAKDLDRNVKTKV